MKTKNQKEAAQVKPLEQTLLASKVLFTSQDWEYTKIKPVRQSSSVELKNGATGGLVQMAVESGNDPGYQASFHFEQFLSTEMSATVADYLRSTQSLFEANGYTSPFQVPETIGQIPITVSMDAQSDPGNGHMNGTSRVQLGNFLDFDVTYGGLNGSVEVAAKGTKFPLFLANEDGTNYSKVEAINVHRDPRDGGYEGLVTFVDKDGKYHAEGISFDRFGHTGEVVIPLTFPSGTLVAPLTQDGNAELNKVGNYILGQMESAILTGMGGIQLQAQSKYKCVRSILTMFGASIICTIGMLAAAATGPAITLAAILCFSSKAIAIINLILSHLGIAP